MKHDELIDDVARRMTEVSDRPALGDRVLARMDVSSPRHGRRWIIAPALGTAALLVVVSVWGLRSSTGEPTTPKTRAARQARAAVDVAGPSTGGAPAVTGPSRTVLDSDYIAANRRTRPRGPEATRAPIVSEVREEDPSSAPADVPMLPTLAEPTPIVIADIAADALSIAPMEIPPVEITQLVVDPLAPGNPLNSARTGGAL